MSCLLNLSLTRCMVYRYHTGDFAVKVGSPRWVSIYTEIAWQSQDVGGTVCGEFSEKNTAFDREIEGRVQSFSSASRQPPRVSSVSLRLLRMQVKIGVSRNVYREPSVSRRAITRSRKSSGLSLSNATTHSWSSNPNE